MARRDDDDVPWLAEGVREAPATFVPRARLFGGALVAVLLAALVALGVYFAAAHKSDGSGGYARPEDAPLIAADPGPYKVAPVDPGGARITGIDDTIAATAAGRDPGSALLPETAEEPLARPVAGAPATPPTDLMPAPPRGDVQPRSDAAPRGDTPPRAITAAPVVAPVLAPKAESAVPVKAPPPPAAKATPKTEPPTAKPDAPAPKAAKVKPDAKDADAKTGDAATARAKPKADDAPPDAARAAKFDPAAAKPAKADGGAVTLQLGAFSTRDKADAAWREAGSDGALSGLTKRIEPTTRDGATLYRLRAGGVASKDAARALCARLKAAGAACIVAE